ncbi:HlyD family secretion protein [Acidocella sp. KAb 2-4]|uniref:HlyD family secretion protein n=1 Tax=Acidocella sp. KAb 2-4 TaxID=2885158 RepID=UPI001D0930B1|nr:efflux RND transporter periplasmic adaptor subunit [Acidocella sp. KAb 2-4]MCB5944023.1 efflux RND transporter periplasmic adaptor subunit [Acidocella sp. KAb 2-4]
MTLRRALTALAVLLVAAGLYAAWRLDTGGQGPFGAAAPGQVIVSGNIEAHESVLSFTNVQAPIVALPFDEGAEVRAGTVLARLDDRIYRQQVEIDRANVQVAEAQVAVNQSSLAAAQHNIASDQADLAEKQRDAARAQQLLAAKAVSVQTRDLAVTAAKQSAATLAHDEAVAQQAAANIGLAQADLAAAQARQHLDDITLGYTTLTAPFAGVIAVREAELGELAGPGVAIFTLDDLDHVWLRAYVNEPDLGKIRLGEAVDVATDTYPGKIYHGHISFISPQAEFTPKTVQTYAERITLVYRVRIDIDNPTHELLPGMPADARIALLPPGP